MADAKPDKVETKARKWFDLATIRGWIEAGGALVGVIAACVGIYLQLYPAGSKSASSKPATSVVGSINQSGTLNVAGTGNVVSVNLDGYTIEQHEKRLKRQEAELRAAFQQAGDQDSENSTALKTQLDAIQGQLGNIDQSYRQRLSKLQQAKDKLEAVKNDVAPDKLEEAARAIEKGDPKAALRIAAEAGGLTSELEPNNDPLNPNPVKLNKTIAGVIDDKKDTDYYIFVTPPTHRDWIHMDIENRSTTLRPRFNLYNADKVHLDGKASGTSGANLKYDFVSEPDTRYYLQIDTNDNRTRGAYNVRIRPLALYDIFEPNHTALQAKPVELNTPVMAGIMDRHDIDFFRIMTGKAGAKLVLSLENRSSTLRPRLGVYNADKSFMGDNANATSGANLTYQIDIQPDTEYFVSVGTNDRRTQGEYTLTVKTQ